MRRILLISAVALGLTGCTPVIDARLRLLDVSRDGLAKLKQSVDAHRDAAAAQLAADRRRLDVAFDADARGRSPLTDAWVIEARTAYAAAIDAFTARQRRSDQAADADAANLAAIDAALVRLQSLDRSQLQLVNFFGGFR